MAASMPRPRHIIPVRVIEREVAFAVADWLSGGEWSLPNAMWLPGKDEGSVMLRADGDTLTHKGVPIIRRNPCELIPGPFTIEFVNARAVCAVALRRGHLSLYPAQPHTRPSVAVNGRQVPEDQQPAKAA